MTVKRCRSEPVKSDAPAQHFEVFGMPVASRFALPELRTAGSIARGAPRSDHEPIEIDFGDLSGLSDPDASNPLWQWTLHPSGDASFVHGRFGKICVEHMGRILVQPGEAGDGSEFRNAVLGLALPVALFQRRQLLMHVSAVQTASGVWAFAGPSGAGKSTAAYLLSRRAGCEFVEDDVLRFGLDGHNGQVVVRSGPSRLKLWSDLLGHVGETTSGLSPDATREGKFHLPRRLHQGVDQGLLKGIIFLKARSNFSMVRISGASQFAELARVVYRPELFRWTGSQENMLEIFARVSATCHLYRATLSVGLGRLESDIDQIRAIVDDELPEGVI